jgi:hypothetical protein
MDLSLVVRTRTRRRLAVTVGAFACLIGVVSCADRTASEQPPTAAPVRADYPLMVREPGDWQELPPHGEAGDASVVGNVPGEERAIAAAPVEIRDPAYDISDPDAGARLAAISELAASADGNSWAPLAQAAAGDAHPPVRAEALYGLGELGDPMSVQVLEDSLRDPDPDVRQAAIDALSLVDGELAAQALARALGNDDPAVRAAARDALGDLRDTPR